MLIVDSCDFRNAVTKAREQPDRVSSLMAKTCEAINGIIKEGEQIPEEYADSRALDAGLLAAAQAVEHYEISRYGTLKTWADELDLDEATNLLNQTLDEEKQTDKLLTSLAGAIVNQEAEA